MLLEIILGPFHTSGTTHHVGYSDKYSLSGEPGAVTLKFGASESLILLKIVADPKEILLISVISVHIYII